jgi:hypothetical protein
MSNQISIQRTVFTNYKSNAVAYGYRAHDEYGQCYSNALTKEQLDLPDEKFIKVVESYADEGLGDMFSFAQEYEKGIQIDNEFYNYEWLKKALDWD